MISNNFVIKHTKELKGKRDFILITDNVYVTKTSVFKKKIMSDYVVLKQLLTTNKHAYEYKRTN